MVELSAFRAHFRGYFRKFSCISADVRQIIGISKKGTSLNHRAMSEIFSLFLGTDVSDNWGV